MTLKEKLSFIYRSVFVMISISIIVYGIISNIDKVERFIYSLINIL